MLGGVWLIYFGFGLLSAAMAPLIEPVSRDLGLSYTTMGAILGAWPLVYIVAAVPCGAFVDRVGLTWSLFLAALIIAASGGLRAVAFDGATMFVAVGLFGIGGPLISIGAPKAIAQWFQGAERGFAMGVYITGPALGNMLALVLTNSVLMPLTGGDWRQVMLIHTGFILAAAVAWFLLGRHPVNRVVERAARHRETIAGQIAVFRRLLRLPAIRVILAMSIGAFFVHHALGNWLPEMLRSGGMAADEAGLWSAVPTAIGIVGALILAAAVAWFLLGRHPVNRVVERAARHRETIAGQIAVFRRLLRLPAIRVILAMSIGAFFVHHALGNWLPEMLRSGGMAADEAGLWSAVPTAIGIVGALIFPRLATPPRRFAILLVLTLSTGAGALMLLIAGVPALVVAMILQGIARGSLIAVLILVLMETRGVGTRHTGAAVGLFFSAAEVGGVLGPLAIGAASDLTGGFDAGLWLLGAVSAGVIGLLYLHRAIEGGAPAR